MGSLFSYFDYNCYILNIPLELLSHIDEDGILNRTCKTFYPLINYKNRRPIGKQNIDKCIRLQVFRKRGKGIILIMNNTILLLKKNIRPINISISNEEVDVRYSTHFSKYIIHLVVGGIIIKNYGIVDGKMKDYIVERDNILLTPDLLQYVYTQRGADKCINKRIIEDYLNTTSRSFILSYLLISAYDRELSLTNIIKERTILGYDSIEYCINLLYDLLLL